MAKKNGSGWYGEPRRHGLSAKGIKTAQKIPKLSSNGNQFFNVDELTKPTTDIKNVEKIGAETKTGAFLKRTGRSVAEGFEYAKEQLAKMREKEQKKKIKTLEEIDHPLSRKLKAQTNRVDELKEQISINEKPAKEEKLFTELAKEQDELREIQEKVSKVSLSTYSNAELKTLAINHPDETGFLGGILGGGENIYAKELMRRIQAQHDLEKQLDQKRQDVKADSGTGFGDLFSFSSKGNGRLIFNEKEPFETDDEYEKRIKKEGEYIRVYS